MAYRSGVRGGVPIVGGVLALVGAWFVRRQAPWVPWPYLLGITAALVVVLAMVTIMRAGRSWGDRIPRRVRIGGIVVSSMLVVALIPVPWMTAGLDDPPGTAWRLDGRMHVGGERIDPPGRWYWLTVGRPPIVAEVVRSWFTDTAAPVSLRTGSATGSPRLNEPAAAAIGLRAAGYPVDMRLIVELSDPLLEHLPDRLTITHVDGRRLDDPSDWERTLTLLATGASVTVADDDSTTTVLTGPELPYRRVDLIDVPSERLDAMVGGRLARTPIGRWFRGMALGRSHGLMIALVVYAHTSGEDLARGRTITGTGGIRGDGSVTRIGGLPSKARAAAALGADVLIVPAEQMHLLDGLDLGRTTVVPVEHLDDAISALRDPTWETR